MKKLAMTIAIALLMGTTVFAQESDGMLRRSRDYEAARRGDNPTRGSGLVLPIEHGSDTDYDSTSSPLGSGVAVLLGMGVAYLVGKRRKEE